MDEDAITTVRLPDGSLLLADGRLLLADGTAIPLTEAQAQALRAEGAPVAPADGTAEAEPVSAEAAAEAAQAQDEIVGVAEELTGEGSALAEFLDVDSVRAMLARLIDWVQTDVLTLNAAIQAALVFAAIFPALFFGPRLKRFLGRHLRKLMPTGVLRRVADALATLATPIAAWITLTIFMGILSGAMNQADGLVSAAQSLLAAWIIVRIVTLAIRSAFWSKVAFAVVWPIAALDAFGVLGDVFDWMQAQAIELEPPAPGEPAETISLYDVLRAVVIFGAFFVGANALAGLAIGRINATQELNISFKALVAKVINFVLPIIALLAALAAIGFDLTYLAVFGGAAALGIGLGLQKIIGNFLAGFTLLADRSIKPGDVIQIGDTFGRIEDMKSRYVSIRDRDGKEYLVPNAQFMDEGVTNWSHSDRVVCCYALAGVGYGTKDMPLVKKLIEQAARETPRVLKTPEPNANMTGYGESSVDFELRFWINDPMNGISNVRSDILFRLWALLAEHDIEIPFPQRDLHIRSSAVAIGAEPYAKAAE